MTGVGAEEKIFQSQIFFEPHFWNGRKKFTPPNEDCLYTHHNIIYETKWKKQVLSERKSGDAAKIYMMMILLTFWQTMTLK